MFEFEHYKRLGFTPNSKLLAAVIGGSLHALIEQPFSNPIEASITQTQVNGKGFVYNFSDLLRKNALFRSLPAALAGAVPKAMIHYSILNTYIGALAPGGDMNKANAMQATLIGGAVGATEVILTNPINFVKFRMQRPEWGYSSTGDAIKTIYRTEGLRAFWKGTFYVILRNTVCNAGMVGGFKGLDLFFENSDLKMNDSTRHLLAGSLAGIVGSFVSYPFEMMRAAKQHNISFYKDIYSKGWRRLLAGYLPGAGRLIMTSAIMGSIIPHLKKIEQLIAS